jgi:hypothetical protein
MWPRAIKPAQRSDGMHDVATIQDSDCVDFDLQSVSASGFTSASFISASFTSAKINGLAIKLAAWKSAVVPKKLGIDRSPPIRSSRRNQMVKLKLLAHSPYQ